MTPVTGGDCDHKGLHMYSWCVNDLKRPEVKASGTTDSPKTQTFKSYMFTFTKCRPLPITS